MKKMSETLLNAIPTDARDGLLSIRPYAKGWMVSYAPGSVDEINEAFRAFEREFPDMYLLKVLGDGAGIYVSK